MQHGSAAPRPAQPPRPSALARTRAAEGGASCPWQARVLSTPSWMAKQLVGRMLGLLHPTTRNKAAVQGRPPAPCRRAAGGSTLSPAGFAPHRRRVNADALHCWEHCWRLRCRTQMLMQAKSAGCLEVAHRPAAPSCCLVDWPRARARSVGAIGEPLPAISGAIGVLQGPNQPPMPAAGSGQAATPSPWLTPPSCSPRASGGGCCIGVRAVALPGGPATG